MRVCYNKLWKLLIDRGMTRSQLRELVPISTVTLAKMGKGENISLRILGKISHTLNCNVEAIVDLPANKTTKKTTYLKPKQIGCAGTKKVRKQEALDMFSSKLVHHYISKEKIIALYRKLHWNIKEESLKRYLNEWSDKGMIFSAGRGWYSDLSHNFVLYTEPLLEVVTFLKATFPLLDILCWSTRQLSACYHHLPGKFHTFVYVDRYAIREVAMVLREKYPDQAILENPGKHETTHFFSQDNKIIIRPILHDDLQLAATESFLPIEGILVDYAIEANALLIIDSAEYSCILNNIASNFRLNPGAIHRRLVRRNAKNQYTEILRNYFK